MSEDKELGPNDRIKISYGIITLAVIACGITGGLIYFTVIDEPKTQYSNEFSTDTLEYLDLNSMSKEMKTIEELEEKIIMHKFNLEYTIETGEAMPNGLVLDYLEKGDMINMELSFALDQSGDTRDIKISPEFREETKRLTDFHLSEYRDVSIDFNEPNKIIMIYWTVDILEDIRINPLSLSVDQLDKLECANKFLDWGETIEWAGGESVHPLTWDQLNQFDDFVTSCDADTPTMREMNQKLFKEYDEWKNIGRVN